MNVEEIRDLGVDEIKAQLIDLNREVMEIRMGNAIGTTESPVEIRHKKRAIARLKTVLHERELGIR